MKKPKFGPCRVTVFAWHFNVKPSQVRRALRKLGRTRSEFRWLIDEEDYPASKKMLKI